jgi:glucose-1-phosphate cytidylyltransferase
MKVVLFCGGLGLRMREASPRIPKPMVPIGNRPILWHIMKYYAHFGHKDFVICLGHKADVIKDYFLTYNEAIANDFVLSEGGKNIELLGSDMQEWRITFANTGLRAKVGERLLAVRQHLEGEDYFLATYGDAVTNAPLPDMISALIESGKAASFLCVRPKSYSFHTVAMNGDGLVTGIESVTDSGLWINGGFFVLRNDIFDSMHAGEELVEEPFRRLIDRGDLLAYRYDGFWEPMDTLKDRDKLETMVESGSSPWQVWDRDIEAEAVHGAPAEA